MFADEPLELADELGVSTKCEIRVDPLLEDGQTALFELLDYRLRERLECQLRERRTPPQSECFAELVGTRGVRCVASFLHEALEAAEVDVLGRYVEDVPGITGEQELRPESAAELRDAVVQRAFRRPRRLFAPQRVEETVDRNHFAGVEEEQREQRPLLLTWQRHKPTVVADLDRPKKPEIHVTFVAPSVRERQVSAVLAGRATLQSQ
jgi:hypothetical protein